jgi:tetrahydromethanopterin:alpha-L-glutamate ligase
MAAAPRRPDLFLVASRLSRTNASLLAAAAGVGLTGEWVKPGVAARLLAAGDTALTRVEARPTIDAVECGTWELPELRRAGVRVLNSPDAVLTAHDKLALARALAARGLPHGATASIIDPAAPSPLPFPIVVRPRYAAWGTEVLECETPTELRRTLERLTRRSWFRRHGALVQQLVPPPGYDLRLVVAAGRVVAAAGRRTDGAAWRQNIARADGRLPFSPTPRSVELALASADAVGADFVGVDLVPRANGDYVVLDVDTAVDFTEEYAYAGGDVFEDAVVALAAAASLRGREGRPARRESLARPLTPGRPGRPPRRPSEAGRGSSAWRR